MAEEKKSSGLFWLALLIFGGGAAWAISNFKKDKVDSVVKPGVKGGDIKNPTNSQLPDNNSNQNNPSNGNNNTIPDVPKINIATDHGYPYSIDTKKIMTYGNKYIDPLSATNGTPFGVYAYTDKIGGVLVTYNVVINNGMIYLQKSVQKNVEKFMFYPYDIETGKFLDIIANDTYTIE